MDLCGCVTFTQAGWWARWLVSRAVGQGQWEVIQVLDCRKRFNCMKSCEILAKRTPEDCRAHISGQCQPHNRYIYDTFEVDASFMLHVA